MESDAVEWKFSQSARPRRNHRRQGICKWISSANITGKGLCYLGQLAPVKIVARIKLEDEDIINLRSCPYPAIEAKKEHEEKSEEIATVYLPDVLVPRLPFFS